MPVRPFQLTPKEQQATEQGVGALLFGFELETKRLCTLTMDEANRLAHDWERHVIFDTESFNTDVRNLAFDRMQSGVEYVFKDLVYSRPGRNYDRTWKLFRKNPISFCLQMSYMGWDYKGDGAVTTRECELRFHSHHVRDTTVFRLNVLDHCHSPEALLLMSLLYAWFKNKANMSSVKEAFELVQKYEEPGAFFKEHDMKMVDLFHTIRDSLHEDVLAGDTYSSYRTIFARTVDASEYHVPNARTSQHPEHPFISTRVHRVFEKLTGCDELSFVYDGSVAGPEVKPKKPQTIQEASDSIERLYRNKIETDSWCSFHVHVSAQEIHGCVPHEERPKYDKRLQAYMMEYIVAHIDKAPHGMVQRLKNKGNFSQFFPVDLNDRKYAFVSFNSNFGTWEFRCFGNIKDATAALQCVRLAGEAYLYALRRASKKQRKLLMGGPAGRNIHLLKKTLQAFADQPFSGKRPDEIFAELNQEYTGERRNEVGLTELRRSNREDYRSYEFRENRSDHYVEDSTTPAERVRAYLSRNRAS